MILKVEQEQPLAMIMRRVMVSQGYDNIEKVICLV
jgi:hypothetical protein